MTWDSTIQVAIPSYKRAATLRAKTLRWLRDSSVPPENITVFVANEDERKDYTAELVPGTFGHVVVGERGMGAIRRFIAGHYPAGTKVLNADDDIQQLLIHVDEKTAVPYFDLHTLAVNGFEMCQRSGAKLWGVYAVKNPYFMKKTVTFDLRYVNGTLWGNVAGDDAFKVTLDDKEDFERTLRCYVAHGAVVRFNYIACDTNFYSEPGGMQEDRTEARITESAKLLVARYPGLCTLNESKKSGHTEVRLKDRRKRA